MAKKIVFGVEIDTNQAQQSIDALNEKLYELNQSGESTEEVIEGINKEIEELGKNGKKSTEELGKGFKGLGSSVGGFLKSLGIVTLVVAAFQELSEALKRNQKAADLMATASKTLEITLDTIVQKGLIPMVEWLQKAFEDPQQTISDFGDLIKENIQTRFEGLIELIPKLGEAISLLFKGEFAEAGKVALDATAKVALGVEDVTDKIISAGEAIVEFAVETFNAAEAQVALNNAAELSIINQQKAILEFQRLAEEQRQIRDDESRSIEERLIANTELGRILEEQALVEQGFAEQRLAAAQAELSRNQGNIELIKQVGEAEIALSEIRERITGQRSEQLVNDISLRKEGVQVIFDEIDAETQLTNVLEAESSKRLENQIEAADAKLEALEEAGLLENELYAQQLQERALLDAEYQAAVITEAEKAAKAQETFDKQVAAEKEQLKQNAFAAATNIAGQLQSLSNAIFETELNNAKGNAEEEEKIRKKAFEANKAFGIVGAVISTAQAVISGFNAGASLGPAGVVMGPVMAALAAATGIAQIAAIASSKYTPTGGGGGSRPAAVPAAPPTPQGNQQPSVSFAGGGNNLNTVGGGVVEETPAPVVNANVTVSETEITGTQQTVSEYENASLLSG